MPTFSGGQIITEYLAREDIPYIACIPGHGNTALIDSLIGKDKPKAIQVKHEQAATHMADGYYKATGKPMAVSTSIGPGALNTAVGVATAYIDSSAMLVLTGSTHTYMKGRGVLQEIERKHWSDFRKVMEPITKWSCEVSSLDVLPRALTQSFRAMMTGRPGPVHLDIPMDVSADLIDVEIPEAGKWRAKGRIRGDAEQILDATKLLLKAQRPVIIAGGGVTLSEGSEELVTLAEFLGAPVLTTLRSNAKGVFPDNHSLSGFFPGQPGSSIGNKLCKDADVILTMGFTFYDEATSSYKDGVTFNIPPTKLIQVDIDPNEVGKNYPVDVGIIGDAKSVIIDILNTLSKLSTKRDYENNSYFKEIQQLRKEWEQELEMRSQSSPLSMGRFFKELRNVLEDDALLYTDAGWPQTISGQFFETNRPRTYITAGGMSTMGFALPGSLGGKLAFPNKQVVSAQGDGSFLMMGEELATAVQYDLPILSVILNNYGFISIRDTQLALHGKDRTLVTEFTKSDGSLYSPDFVKLGEAYGCHAQRISKVEEIKDAVKTAFASGKPSVLEVTVDRVHPRSMQKMYGYWDLPTPKYLDKTT